MEKVFPTHIVAVGGIVKNEKDEILLVKTYKSGWVFPGGQVEIGENLIDAVIREVKEESGIDIAVDTLVAVSSNTATHKGHSGYKIVPTKVMFDFICTYIAGEPCSSEENSESKWIHIDKVLDFIITPAIQERFKAYINFDGNVQYLEYETKPKFNLKLNRKI